MSNTWKLETGRWTGRDLASSPGAPGSPSPRIPDLGQNNPEPEMQMRIRDESLAEQRAFRGQPLIPPTPTHTSKCWEGSPVGGASSESSESQEDWEAGQDGGERVKMWKYSVFSFSYWVLQIVFDSLSKSYKTSGYGIKCEKKKYLRWLYF